MSRGSFVAIVVGVLAALGLLAALTNRRVDVVVTDVAAPAGAAGLAGTSITEAPTSPAPTTGADTAGLESVDAPPTIGRAGTLENIDTWLHTDANALEDFEGQVRIVQFWTYSCRNCTATIPFLQDVYTAYQPRGLEIIGVHAPEFSFEEDLENVALAATELGVTWPVAVDNTKTNFRSWQPGRRFWPRTFVVDQNGDIRLDRIGEGGYREIEETVAWLLENGP